MAKPITPKMAIDTVLCQQLNVNYKQVWDGVAWVITASEVALQGHGSQAEDGNNQLSATVQFVATDLPPAGQTALIELLGYIEDLMVVKYS